MKLAHSAPHCARPFPIRQAQVWTASRAENRIGLEDPGCLSGGRPVSRRPWGPGLAYQGAGPESEACKLWTIPPPKKIKRKNLVSEWSFGLALERFSADLRVSPPGCPGPGQPKEASPGLPGRADPCGPQVKTPGKRTCLNLKGFGSRYDQLWQENGP